MAPTDPSDEVAAIKAAMWAELGAARLDNLPMEDNPRGRGVPAHAPGFGPKRAKPVNSRWQQAIESGDFDDDDAAMVSNMDSMLDGQLARSRRVGMTQTGGQNIESVFSKSMIARDHNGHIPPRARPRGQGRGGPRGHPNRRGLYAGDGPIDINAMLASKESPQHSPVVSHRHHVAIRNRDNGPLLKSAHSPFAASATTVSQTLAQAKSSTIVNAAPIYSQQSVAPRTATRLSNSTGIPAQTAAEAGLTIIEPGFQPTPPSPLISGEDYLLGSFANEAEEIDPKNMPCDGQSGLLVPLSDGDTVVFKVAVVVESRTFEDRGKHAATLHLIKGFNASDSMIVLLVEDLIGANIKHFVSDCASCMTVDSHQGALMLMFLVEEHTNVYHTISFGNYAKCKAFILALQDLQSQIRRLPQSTMLSTKIGSALATPSDESKIKTKQPEQPEPKFCVDATKEILTEENFAQATSQSDQPEPKPSVFGTKETVIEESFSRSIPSFQNDQLLNIFQLDATGSVAKKTIFQSAFNSIVASQTLPAVETVIATKEAESRATHSIEVPQELHDWMMKGVNYMYSTAPQTLSADMVSDMVRTACTAVMMNCGLKNPQSGVKECAKAAQNLDRLAYGNEVSVNLDGDYGFASHPRVRKQTKNMVMALSSPSCSSGALKTQNETRPANRDEKKPRYDLEELVGLRDQPVEPPSWLPNFHAVMPKKSGRKTGCPARIETGNTTLPTDNPTSTFKKPVASTATERAEAIQFAGRLAWQVHGHKKQPSTGTAKAAPEATAAVDRININMNHVVDMQFRSKPESNTTSTVFDSDAKGIIFCESTMESASRVASPPFKVGSTDPNDSGTAVQFMQTQTADVTSPKRGLLNSRHNLQNTTRPSEPQQRISQIDEAFGRLNL
ncbi:hypothetical protein BD289DRAFT_451191 [Coniella lustricola]|uniref:Uncharacterized protein n=1 Tax=Coniella lustricola TaxID=2025994 RepID=A0A2T3AFX6_9PEZI|nr:hypothetical protein BD289DRAFT_451191 [Coniella lustricola]